MANVSLSTVSYALSGVRPVSAATKARIAAAMEELKFQPNAMARGLASRRSRVIALLHPLAQSFYERTSADFIHSASLAARERGYEFVIWPFGPEQATEARNLALQGSADGVLLMEIDTDDARVEALRDTGIPFTMIGRTDDCEGLPYVDIDFEQTMEAAVEHLTTLGHRNIGFLGRQAPRATGGYGPNVRSARSFVEAMDRRNLPRQVLYGDLNPEAGRMAVAEFFFRDPGVTAIVTINETAVFGILVELHDRGIEVPTEFSVLGAILSTGVGSLNNPTLTTFAAPGTALGRLAVDALIDRLAGDSSREIAVLRTCELERGGSTAAAPAKTERQQRVRSTETKRNQPATRPFVGQPVGEGAVSLS